MISGRGRGKIRPPRRALGVHGGNSDFDTQWDILRSALREIHEKNASKLSFEQLYRASYKIVLKKQGDVLYDRVKEYEEQWFGTEVMPKIGKLITKNLVNITVRGAGSADERRIAGENFMKGLKTTWEDHITCMNMTTDILMYMDRVYCSDNRKASIFTTSMGLFRDHILRSHTFGSDSTTFQILTNVLLDQIGMERSGDVIDKTLIRSCIYMLEGLYESDDENENEKLYLTEFEGEFLTRSRAFYQEECQSLLGQDAGTWLRRAKKRLLEEAERCQTTISKLTETRISKVVESELISSHLQEFLAMEGSGLKAMIENDHHEDLTILYQLITRVDPTKEPLKVALQNRVVDLGREVNKSIAETNFAVGHSKDDDAAEGGEKSKPQSLNAAAQATAAAIKWVDEVLQLKDKFDGMWKRCFDEDLIIQTALAKSFSDFINDESRCSEYVSLFIDDNLKRGIKGKTEAEVDIVLDKAITLIRYISDKDMFERYYKKHLARRLLLGKSESNDVEKQMVSRMKQEVGNYFTSKIEGMFKDMSTSKDLTADYRQHIENLGDLDRRQIDLGVSVLTSNYWPSEALGGQIGDDGVRQSVEWPAQIRTLQDSFTAFYLKERNGRKLTWLGNIGQADIRCVFPKIPGKEGVLGRERRHELNVNTYGMLVLLLFNDLAEGESLSFEEIQAKTLIPIPDLARTLTTFGVLPKARVLRKEPANKEMAKPGDRFYFNDQFTSKNIKIKAPVMSGVANRVEGEEERKATEDKNDEHRGNTIDLCVVRVMKARKELSHEKLLLEVIAQLSARFKPEINMMKKRIESLIEREYMERVEGAKVPTYRYMA